MLGENTLELPSEKKKSRFKSILSPRKQSPSKLAESDIYEQPDLSVGHSQNLSNRGEKDRAPSQAYLTLNTLQTEGQDGISEGTSAAEFSQQWIQESMRDLSESQKNDIKKILKRKKRRRSKRKLDVAGDQACCTASKRCAIF